MNTEERFLLRSSVEWRKNLMQDCLCMPCAEFSDSFDAAVDAAIATFPELEREAILKRYRDGLTPTQCANALEIDIGKFYSCFDLAIRRLRHPKYAGGILKEMRRFAGSPLASALKEAVENGNWKKIEELCDSVPFQCLNFSTRTKNCLMFSGAQSIGDVVRLIESGKLKNLRQCGQGTLQNIIDVLEKALPFHFILGKPAQFCPETSDAFTRKEHTRQLSAMLERYIDPRNDPRIYWAREVTFDYSTNHKIRVDYMRFQPLNNSTSGIEKGDFYAYEVKSSVEDFKSPNGHNFIADYNYYVMPADVFEAVKDTVPYGVGVLCPDGGHLRCVRKAVRKDRTRPVSEMLLMLWRSSRRDFPATDVAPVMHTRWAHLGGDEWCCPACGFVITTEGSWDKPTKKYCEDCGAKMDGGADHEDRQD